MKSKDGAALLLAVAGFVLLAWAWSLIPTKT